MYQNISDPRIGQAFSALASILVPNTDAMIAAEQAGLKTRGLELGNAQTEAETTRIGADTTRIGADTNRINADAAKIAAQKATIDGYNAANKSVADILASGVDLNDPNNRAKLAAALAQTEHGLQYGPGAATGFSSYIDPNFANPADMANTLVGTGVVGSYAQTQPGQAATIAGEAARNDADNQTISANNAADNARAVATNAADNLAADARSVADNVNAAQMNDADNATSASNNKYSVDNRVGPNAAGAKPAAVTPSVAKALNTQLADTLTAQYGVDPADVDPALLSALGTEAAAAYAVNHNASQAIADVLAGLQKAPGAQGFLWDGPDTVSRTIPGGAAPAPTSAPAPASAPAAVPAASAPPMAVNPKTGEKLQLVNGQWVPLGPHK